MGKIKVLIMFIKGEIKDLVQAKKSNMLSTFKGYSVDCLMQVLWYIVYTTMQLNIQPLIVHEKVDEW
jgi:uncharacterized Fe-S cluster-containing radical SAM superfamily enzyme